MAYEPSFEEEEKEYMCKNVRYDPQLGVKICEDTGEVLEEDFIADDASVKAYTPEEKEKKAHYGPSLKYSDVYMGVTSQLEQPREHGPKGLGRPGMRHPFPRHPRAASGSIDKNLQIALNLVHDVIRKLELPDIVGEEASKIYRDAMQKGLTRGRSIESIVAASLYAACRIHGLPHSLHDIIKAMRGNVDAETKREVARSYRLMVRDLGLKIPVRKPENFVYMIANALGLPEKVAIEAIKIINEARRNGLTAGKDPSGMAGAAVYLAALKHGIRKTQKEIAHVAGVTEVTIRNRYKEIMKVAGIEVEEELEEF